MIWPFYRFECLIRQIPLNLYYPIFALTMLFLVALFIPKAQFRHLFWISLFWGFFVCHFFILIFGALLNLFQWVHAFPYVFLSAPIFIKIAWLFSIMLYFYFLPRRNEWYVLPMYILMFSFISAALDQIFHQMGLLVYYHWNPWFRFLLAVVWFYLAQLHYRVLYPGNTRT